MKSNLLLIIATLLLSLGGFLIVKNNHSALQKPIVVSLSQENPTPAPSPTPTPFQFDSSTNLKQELDSVDPVVEDDKINQLKGLIRSL